MLFTAATTMPKSLNKPKPTLLETITRAHPEITFLPGARFAWNPKTSTIHYHLTPQPTHHQYFKLLHELGHALLDHQDFESDMQLLQMEAAAWQKANELGKKYELTIDEDYIQDCLDSYRDWLHLRSTCPTCFVRCLQQDRHTYQCHNCGTEWHVTNSRLCRPYRLQK